MAHVFAHQRGANDAVAHREAINCRPLPYFPFGEIFRQALFASWLACGELLNPISVAFERHCIFDSMLV